VALPPKPVILSLDVYLTDGSIAVDVTYNVPVSSHILYQYGYPVAVPRFVLRRGRNIYCGSTYRWHIVACIPALQVPPALFWHHLIPRPEPGGVVSFFLSNNCNAILATWTSVPFFILTPPCPPRIGYPITATVGAPPNPTSPKATIQTIITY